MEFNVYYYTGKMEPDDGDYKWGITISTSYFPKDNTEFSENVT
jgi:hypothetical protein